MPRTDRGRELFHHLWTQQNQEEPPARAAQSRLLDLHRSSDVDDIPMEQIRDARTLLRVRREVLALGPSGTRATVHGEERVVRLQRAIVERFLAGRRDYFGDDQCTPLPDLEQMAAEGRDVFVVVKFMDESPHLAATLHSLLNQVDADLGRVVLAAVDNNSQDGSDAIVRRIAASQRTPARVVYLNQPRPGAGNAARLGVDRCIATIYDMCRRDLRWSRLQRAVIAVSDGDTVYHPRVLAETLGILDRDQSVDGVMPFLTYKLTAALRLFSDHIAASPEALRRRCDVDAATPVGISLARSTATELLPRRGRRLTGDAMELEVVGHSRVEVPLASADEHGRRFGVLRDVGGRLAYVMEDRTVVLEGAPASGFDAALTFLENGGVRPDEKWRWHALVGHDLFLSWAFVEMGLPEQMIFPDTSDALKTFRAWSFAIGGQHQLRRPDLNIATGSDYQSGRVLQAVGNTIRLGPAEAPAETEIDRLIKMVRNLVHRQSVFYGETRATALERATGLYVHMTLIQDDLEEELRRYGDDVFGHTVLPERLLLSMRWILQNAVRFYAHGPAAREVVRHDVLRTVFARSAAAVESRWFNDPNIALLRRAAYEDKQDVAEAVAEGVIAERYPEILEFYARTLRSFLDAQLVPSERTSWLLADLESCRNAVLEKPPPVHPAVVWDGDEFVIDEQRGQVVGLRPHRWASSTRADSRRASIVNGDRHDARQ